jgi:hypothetical protein
MALRKSMPKVAHAWPKLELIHSRLRDNSVAALIPRNPTLVNVRKAAASCRACDLWKTGTQTVFGEGKKIVKVMFVGEIPGDKEDLAGRPFVGPAGQFSTVH